MHYACCVLTFPLRGSLILLFLSDPSSNELIVLRLLHFIFGIIWIRVALFLPTLSCRPLMQKLDFSVRVKCSSSADVARDVVVPLVCTHNRLDGAALFFYLAGQRRAQCR